MLKIDRPTIFCILMAPNLGTHCQHTLMELSPFAGHIRDRLTEKSGRTVTLTHSEPLAGGGISECFLVHTDSGRFFLKRNAAENCPGMFPAEARGLDLLRRHSKFRIPIVMAEGNFGSYSYLLLEYIEHEEKTSHECAVEAGHRLAAMHGESADYFGLDHANYIGTLEQTNLFQRSWIDFFIGDRLEPQLKLATDKRRISEKLHKRFATLFNRLDSIIPPEPPALLHGDLWSGNFLCSTAQEPVLVDPAAYYGHREVDIAMTRLFGGFPNSFYEAYQAARPLEPEWESRVDIFNLYPLLVHVNLFGSSYARQVEQLLKKWD